MKKFNREMAEYFDRLYAEHGKALVYGEGARGAELVLIGEAPGEQETRLGRPFVGKAGKNLDYFLERTGFDRAQLYITNVVKFRPTKISKAGRTVNRPPTREEVELFTPWLLREIALVAPKCVVTMGNTALHALASRKAVIGQVHGQFIEAHSLAIFPVYHPASLIYNRSLMPIYEQDLIRLNEWRAQMR